MTPLRNASRLCAGLALAAAVAAPSLLGAQRAGGAGGIVVDRIVAVVGTKPILQSQVEEQLAQLQATGQQVPTDSSGRAALRRQVLNQMVEEELLVQQAERDTTVKVTDQEVQEAVEQSVQNVRRQFASEQEFQGQLRLAGFASAEEWRRYLADNQRRALQSQRLLDIMRQKRKLRPIPPTDAEMRAFWEANRARQPKRPAGISFRQIVLVPQADSAAKARARQSAESLLVALRHGADFAVVAKRFSDDSATREAGGELGWFRRGAMVKAFENVAFRLKPGEISDVVESEFGFHIIQVERVQPAEILARHVLLVPAVSAAQVEAGRRLADSIRSALAAGASFDSLARRYGDPNEQKLAESAPVSQLPAEYQRVLATDSTQGLKPVFLIGERSSRPKFVILDLIGRQPEGDYTFDDLKDRIRQTLGQDLGIRHYLDQLRRVTYIDIRL